MSLVCTLLQVPAARLSRWNQKLYWSAQFVGGYKRCKWNPDVRMNLGATCQKPTRAREQAASIASCFVDRPVKQGEKKAI